MDSQTPTPFNQSAQAPAPAQPKAEFSGGGSLAAFVPQNFDQAWRLSQALAHGAASVIPDAYRGKEGAVFAAIAKGAELGLTPMASLATIAVINGRASLWGDALPALVRHAGHQMKEWVEGDTKEKWTAYCTVTRGDTGEEITREFSWDDAVRAGLSKKQGPWQQYPKRMLAMRARGFAVRDGVAEIMVGLAVVEEINDHQPIRDVTPATTRQESTNSIIAALPDEQSVPVTVEAERETVAETISDDASLGAVEVGDEGQGDLLRDDGPTEEERAAAEEAALASFQNDEVA